MRTGLTISCVAHVRCVGAGLVGVSAQPMSAPPVEACRYNSFPTRISRAHQGRQERAEAESDEPKPLADKVDAPKPVKQLAPKVATSRRSRPTRPRRSPAAEPKPADKPDKPEPPGLKPDQIANLLKKDTNK